ncbi:hypothetical protein GP5015_895 [gamma proteobacterium HTCC5015]|nr:hypothetical protein GP5015_895 [gamma proteobacterium HTCC5015]
MRRARASHATVVPAQVAVGRNLFRQHQLNHGIDGKALDQI